MASKLIVNEIEHTDGSGTAVTMAKATIANATITTGTIPAASVTGTLGSGVTFPAGMVRQVKTGVLGSMASGTSDTYLPSSALSFANAIISGSHVFVLLTGNFIQRASDGNLLIHLTGGGLGSGASGYTIGNFHGSYGSGTHMRANYTGSVLDTSPGSTTPSYQVFHDINAGTYQVDGAECGNNLILMEILT